MVWDAVELSTVQKCVLGQHTDVFKRQKGPVKKAEVDCSFSLIYMEGGTQRYVLLGGVVFAVLCSCVCALSSV